MITISRDISKSCLGLHIQMLPGFLEVLPVGVVPVIGDLYGAVQDFARLPLLGPVLFLHVLEIAAAVQVAQLVFHDLGQCALCHIHHRPFVLTISY